MRAAQPGPRGGAWHSLLATLLLLMLLCDATAAQQEPLLRAGPGAGAAEGEGTEAAEAAAAAPGAQPADSRLLLSGRAGQAETRIVGGQPASAGRYKWSVSLQRKKTGHFCGGSLVTSKFVLTAAHCLDGAIDSVVLGVQDLKASSGRVVRRAARVVAHPKYSSLLKLNDIGLVELDTPVTTVTPMLLGVSAPAAGTVTTVVGWGSATFGGNMQTRMRQVSVPVVSRTDCTAPGAYSKGSIHTSNLCAGFAEGVKDSCQGDSGGPLFLPVGSDLNDTQVGIVSWGSGCARPQKYGVYTSVSSFRAWIASVVGAQNLRTARPAGKARAAGGGDM